jgi:hypothetical protein
MTESAVERETSSPKDDVTDSEEALIARIAADRREGKDTTKDVEKLLQLTGAKNRAALDRLAK